MIYILDIPTYTILQKEVSIFSLHLLQTEINPGLALVEQRCFELKCLHSNFQDEKRSSDQNSVYSKGQDDAGGNQHIESSLPSSPAPASASDRHSSRRSQLPHDSTRLLGTEVPEEMLRCCGNAMVQDVAADWVAIACCARDRSTHCDLRGRNFCNAHARIVGPRLRSLRSMRHEHV